MRLPRVRARRRRGRRAARPAAAGAARREREPHVQQPLAAVGERCLPRRLSMPRAQVAHELAVSSFTRSMRCASRQMQKRAGPAPAPRGARSPRSSAPPKRLVIWNERPMPARVMRVRREPGDRLPCKLTVPRSGANMPEMRLKAVVLPAPLGPISACSVRSRTAIDAGRPPGCRRSSSRGRAPRGRASPGARGRRNSGRATPCSIERAAIAAASTTLGASGAVIRRRARPARSGENTTNATNSRPK